MTRKYLLYKLGLFIAAHKWTTLVCCLIITAVLGFFAAQIEVNLGFLTLLDRNDPEVLQVDYVNENFGGMDYTFISISADSLYNAKRFADAYAKEIQKSDMILRVVHKIDIDALMRYGLLFMEPDQIDDFEKVVRENQNDFADMFRDVYASPFLGSFNRMLERQILEKQEIGDPDQARDQLVAFDGFLNTMGQYLEQGEKLGPYKLKIALRDLFIPDAGDSETTIKDEYMLATDQSKLMMLVMPSEAGDDMVFTARFMQYLESTAKSVGGQFPGASLTVGGNIAIMADEYAAIQKDTKVTTAATFVLVLFIFFYFFRRLSDLTLIGICLVTGIVWTYAVTYFYIGFLGITTAFFSAILLGLGIDFAIHLIARYGEWIQAGKPVPEAIGKAMAGAGPGIITGALTTSAAFYVLMVCRFKGISQLGFVAGTGILSMVVIMFTMLPAMIAIRDDRKNTKVKASQMRELAMLSTLSDFMVRHRRPAALVILVVTIGMAAAAWQIRFNYDFRSLEPRGGKAVEANHELERDFGKSIDYGLLFAESVDESRALAKGLKTKKSVGEVRDISEYLPEHQDEKIPRIRAIEPLISPLTVERAPTDTTVMDQPVLDQLARTVRESRRMVLAIKQLAIVGGNFEVEDQCTKVMARADRLADTIDKKGAQYIPGGSYYQQTLGKELAGLLGNLKQAAMGEKLGIDQLPSVIRDNFIGKDGKFLVYAYPEGYLWNQEGLTHQRDDLRSLTENSTSIGMMFLTIIDKIKQDFRFAVWLSLGVVFMLVLADFRRIPTAVMALVPLVMGAVWMVGTMVLLGLTFNLINVAVVPLIIGIGIDNGVHIIHRYRSESSDKIRMSVQHTGRAIFLSSITTMAGFGSLGLASYVAVATLGWVLLIGVFYCLFTSVVVLPIILSLVEDRIGRI